MKLKLKLKLKLKNKTFVKMLCIVLAACAVCIITVTVLILPVGAADETDATDEIIRQYSDMLSDLPSDVAEMLPEELFSGNIEQMSDAVSEAGGFSYIFGKICEIIGLKLKSSVGLLATLCGLLVLSSVMRASGDALSGSTVKATSFCSGIAIIAAILSAGFDIVGSVRNYLTELNVITGSMIPIMSIMYAMGGNVGAAVANTGTLTVFLSVCEFVCNSTLVPWFSICLGLATVSAVAPSVKLHGISSVIKRVYTFSLGFVMLLLTATLSVQTTLSSASDGLAYKGAKYAASAFIPVVGGTVGETLGTLATSISFLKSTLGLGGIIVIVLMVLPVIISIALRRIVYMLAASVGEMLGCERESKLLSEITGLYGYLLGVVCICSIEFILILTVFVKCTVAWSA